MKASYEHFSSKYTGVLRVTAVSDNNLQDHIGKYIGNETVITDELENPSNYNVTDCVDEALSFSLTDSDKLQTAQHCLKYKLGVETELLLIGSVTSVVSIPQTDMPFDPDFIMCNYYAIGKTKELMALYKDHFVGEDRQIKSELKWLPAKGFNPSVFILGMVDIETIVNNDVVDLSTVSTVCQHW